jgi:hypothetical protein
MELGKMTISEAYPYIKMIADEFGLRLNRAKEFKMARIIFTNRFNRIS